MRLIALIALACFACGCAPSPNKVSANRLHIVSVKPFDVPPGTGYSPQFAVRNTEAAWVGTSRIRVVGDLANGPLQLRDVAIIYDCLDSNGRKIAQAIDTIETIAPNQTWRFSATTSNRETHRFEIQTVLYKWDSDSKEEEEQGQDKPR